MLEKKLRKQSKKVLKRIIAISIALTIVVTAFCEYQMKDFKCQYIILQAEKISSETIGKSVNDFLEEKTYSYDDFVILKYSPDGYVQSITTNSIKINEFKIGVIKKIKNNFQEINDIEIGIPMGAITGVTVLSNYGPEINMSFSLTGDFTAQIKSTFEETGINQTIHHIQLIVSSRVITTTLDYNGNLKFSSDFEIAQSIIIGKVPQSYRSIYENEGAY